MTDPGDYAPSPVAEMRLRPKPRPVLRLSRKVLIGVGGICATGLAVALAAAVVPQKSKPAPANATETSAPHARPSTEVLDALPKDYTGVPKLGPPLPGDLGRPLLSAAQNASASPSYADLPAGVSTHPIPAPMSNQQSQLEQARSAARTSQLFFTQGSMASRPIKTSSTSADPLAGFAALTATATPEIKSDPDRKRAFLDQASDRQTVSDARLIDPASPYLLLTGSVVPAALITGIRSDIPGQVLAQVTQDVRDSLTGEYLLIPKGSRLIGQYDNAISFGQSRLLLTWSRLVLPNGKSLILDKLSAADARGFAGLQDKTDYHWASIVNAAAVSTLLAMGAEAGDPQSDSALIQAVRNGAADSVNRTGQQIVERQLNIQPTLTIRPGLPVRVILSRDLVLEPYGN